MPLSLGRLYPIPAHIDREAPVIAGDRGENWYNWCVEHWGTKWDVGEVGL